MAGIIRTVRSSIILKLIISYTLIVLIPITLSGMYILKISQESVKERMFSLVEDQLKQLERNITERIDLCKHNIISISMDRNLIGLLQDRDYDDAYLISTVLDDVLPKIKSIRGQNALIQRLMVIHGSPRVPEVFDYLYHDTGFDNGIWSGIPGGLNRDEFFKFNRTYLEPTHVEVNYFKIPNDENRKGFSLYSPIFDTGMDRVLGIVEMDIPESMILDFVKQIDTREYGIITLVSDEGILLYSNKGNTGLLPLNDLKRMNNFSIVKVEGKKYYLAKIFVSNLKSWIAFYIPEGSLQPGSTYNLWILGILAAGLITLIIISFFLSRLMLNRLLKLSKTMNLVKDGNLKTRINIESTDEISHLGDNFNKMLDRLNILMESLEKSHKAEKEALYKALQNQISPHFLCNALDMVRMTAEVRDELDLSHSIELISNYYMYNIRKKDKYVRLEDELENAFGYIAICNMIKNNSIRHDVKICSELSEKADKYYILNFIIQPMVENSIKHGFADKEDNCRIVIEITYDKDTITILIEDNGCGISPERMDEVNQYLDLNRDSSDFRCSGSGIGIRNIKERLSINYGDSAELTLESRLGLGTCVVLKIPALDHIDEPGLLSGLIGGR